MRDKDAAENERKNLVRNIEKQAKAIEKLVESEKNLSERVVSFMTALVLEKNVLIPPLERHGHRIDCA